ncbi:MAG: flagellar biosynthesis anti-sigma factor FlgM [Acidobacteriota bacterium]|nr:flagellar biosynthesis anti-sigma factor FlgM [Acidobacteriota bacterium]
MKIYDSNVGGAASAGTQRTQETQQTGRTGGARTASTSGDSPDRVEFSGALGRLSHTIGEFQSNRTTRVQALTGQYRGGGYQPDSLATSRAMITETLNAAGAGLQ